MKLEYREAGLWLPYPERLATVDSWTHLTQRTQLPVRIVDAFGLVVREFHPS